MKNIIKKITNCIGYIIKGGKLETKLAESKAQLENMEKENFSLKDKLCQQELLENQLSDLRYFVDEVIPEIFTEKFVNKKAAYNTFLKVVKRTNLSTDSTNRPEPKITQIKSIK